MNASKAKRRLLRWHRYLKATGSIPTSYRRNAGYHLGHVKAYHNYLTAQRAVPNGVRVPWTRLAERPGT